MSVEPLQSEQRKDCAGLSLSIWHHEEQIFCQHFAPSSFYQIQLCFRTEGEPVRVSSYHVCAETTTLSVARQQDAC